MTAILGGGQGTRLWPLTLHRAKPAVPIGGKFRLIDIPVSNSLHAGIEQDVDLRWPDQYLAGKEQLERHRRRPAGMVIDI